MDENYCNIGGKWYKCCNRECDNCDYYLYDINKPSNCYYEYLDEYEKNGFIDENELI